MEIFWRHESDGHEIKTTTMTADIYPERLLSIPRAPSGLYFKGDIGIINQNMNIAVIGSRRVSEIGGELAYRAGYALGKMGVNVVNGLALGCDTYALRGALDAGGRCVAVMPCGLEQVVPRSNGALADRLLSCGGCLISEYPVFSSVGKYRYVERDRLQSGVSGGVVVIEAEYGSGTMHTVKYAIKQGRRLACIDSGLVKHSSGNRWIEGQDGVKVIRSHGDLEEFVGMSQDDSVYRQLTLAELDYIDG